MKGLHLVLNAGSQSLKVALFDQEKLVSSKTFSGRPNFQKWLRDFLKTSKVQKILKKESIYTVSHRIVHGGAAFHKPTRVTKASLKKVSNFSHLAPLHNPPAIDLIKISSKMFSEAQHWMFFDTAFHHDIPEVNHRYALPKKWADSKKLRRYGFHGLVYASLVRQLKAARKLKKRMILCHLGGGCSAVAVKNGVAIDTTMGFTPLEGMVMATRSGSIDPGLLLFLQQHLKMKPQKIHDLLHSQSGLKGLSGTPDMKQVLKKKSKDPAAEMAFQIFCHSVAQSLAKLTISLGGVDQIVFSGGIGENAPEVRESICQLLKPLGVRISASRNQKAKAGKRFHRPLSSVTLSFLYADEAGEMNQQLLER